MPGTISTEKPVSAACSVFKIDLKGRFVYIDDETEELFGLTREELFGKSIYEFISNDSHQVLDAILGNHNRYESFYESLPLTIRESDGQFRQLEAVITLNFISGNPVNYQFILLPSRASEFAPGVNWERRLLELIRFHPEEIDFNQISEMFCAISGYTASECYLNSEGHSLEIVGSFPHQDPGHSAPVYLERLKTTAENKFSFIPEDRALQEGFGNGKSEAILTLPFHHDKNLLVWLYGPAEYQPAVTRMDDIRLFSQTWDAYFQTECLSSSPGFQFTALGQVGDALKLGMVVVNGEYEIIYSNNCFSQVIHSPEETDGESNFRDLYERLEVYDVQGQPMPFEKSPFSRSVRQRQLEIDCLKFTGCERPLTVLGGPVSVAETQFFVYCLIPYHERAAEACSLNRSGTKLVLSVAHDIRAPLITIEAFAKRLQANYADQLDDEGRFAADCIVENGRLLQEMIDGLGEMSQNWGAQEAPEKLYVKRILEELVTYLCATYPNTKYRIRIPESLPEISAPKRKLIQLFRNILDNAFKYSVSVDRPSVKVEYNLVDGWHQFSMSDNGPGIEADYKRKIFAPFFRAPEVVSLPGTGMGLAIASDIIASWGGKIWHDTSYSHGARITFILPPHIKG